MLKEEALTSQMMLGRSGLRVPRLGIGAMTWGEPSEFPRWNPARFAYGLAEGIDEQRKALEVSIEGGANLVDTAAFYGKGASERRVGALARDKGVLLATKYPFRLFSGSGTLPRDLEDSLSRLHRTTVDLYQIHFPIPWRPIPRLMHLMADAVEAGKVRAVGVSNFSAAQMRQAHAVLATRGIPLASNQVEYSLLHRASEVDGVLDACRELGVTLIAFQPLASGALTGKYSVANPPTGMRRHAPMFRRDNLELLSPVIRLLKEIGERYQKSPGQVALRWLIERGALPIPGAKNSAQAAHNAGALAFTLEAAEVEALDRATAASKK
jgi:aryl-alcohol dehydrogenase-like predicted oxidoreductase